MSQHSKGSSGRLTSLVEQIDFPAPLNAVLGTHGIEIRPTDRWRPNRKIKKEATVKEMEPFLPKGVTARELVDWWLSVELHANTPNWDLISTCQVQGHEGLLIVEAKAHASECSGAGKRAPTTSNGDLNHIRISGRIGEANVAWRKQGVGRFSLSADSHYQLCNRMTWLWHLAEMRIPTVLLYLGFLGEKQAFPSDYFEKAEDWEATMREYMAPVMPPDLPGKVVKFNGTPAVMLVESL
ncbi:MAG: hypothetical protein ABW168_06770 [Sedimenticola sp.]